MREKVFLFPDHLDLDSYDSEHAEKGEWMSKDSFTEQIVFDLRTSPTADSASDYTFKKELDVWQYKPTLVTSEEIKDGPWKPNLLVHHLHK